MECNCGSRALLTCICFNKQGHLEPSVWAKYPHLEAEQQRFFVKSEGEALNEVDDVICLVESALLLHSAH